MISLNKRGLFYATLGFFAGLLVALSHNVAFATTPAEHYRLVWQKVGDTFLFEDRLKDWDTKRQPGKFQTMSEAERSIQSMVNSLGDKYTYYKTASATTSDSKRQQQKNVVSHKTIGNIGYIKIQTFSSVHTAQEVEQALKAMPAVDAYIIDLRGNGGGLVWQSFRVFALFHDKGLYKTGKGRWQGKPWSTRYELTGTVLRETEGGRVTEKPRPKHLSGDKPIIILVNAATASASESLAGALRYHGRATLVGETTFGKGITQTTFDLAHGTSVRVTYAYTYQPDGNCIHGKGMKPDHNVPDVKGKDAQLDHALGLLLPPPPLPAPAPAPSPAPGASLEASPQ